MFSFKIFKSYIILQMCTNLLNQPLSTSVFRFYICLIVVQTTKEFAARRYKYDFSNLKRHILNKADLPHYKNINIVFHEC